MTKKKEVGVTDPFKFPPCEFTEIIYASRQPFVDIVKGRLETLPENKFAGKRMQSGVLDVAIAEAGKSKTFVERMFAAGGRSELNLRPAHIMALATPGWFAKPTGEEWKKFLERNPEWTKKSLKTYMRSLAGGEPGPTGANEGLAIVRHDEPHQIERDCTDAFSSSSEEEANSGFQPQHEKAAQNEAGRAGAGREDLLVFVRNRAECKKFVTRRRVLPPDPNVLVLSAECKDEPHCEVEALYQAAACANAGIIRNVLNGHGKPVDLLCMGQQTAYHGLLVVHGVVKLTMTDSGENEISTNAYMKYKQTCVTTNREELSHAELNKRLADGLDTLREFNDERMHLPAGKYLVGELHLPSSELELPSTLKKGSMVSEEARAFTEGLLRAVIGDAVLQWTPDRVLFAKLIRLAMLEDSMKEGGAETELATADKRFESYRRLGMPPDARRLEFERMLVELEAFDPSLIMNKAADICLKHQSAPAGSLEHQGSATARLELSTSVQAIEQREPEASDIAAMVKIEPVVKLEPTSEVTQVKIEPPTRKRAGAGTGASASKKSKKGSGSASARKA